MSGKTDLSAFDNNWYKPGANVLVRCMWYLVNAAYFKSSFPFSRPRVFWLRLFGARVGKGVVIKPGVNIKYPWNLSIGDHSWIGENVWIDNLAKVAIGSNACISQGAMLLTGNHNYKKKEFDLMVEGITIEDGAWIGAQSMVAPGVTCRSHSVLSVMSVAVEDLEAYAIYHGNPAVKVRERVIA
ncbi:MAG: WcaF family extracellular polysaccharide biosynthesis acetyltransferase [Bacteroidota bacterium]